MFINLAGNAPVLPVLVFIAVVLLCEGLYLVWKSYRGADAKKIHQRLNTLSAGAERVAGAQSSRQQVQRVGQLLLEPGQPARAAALDVRQRQPRRDSRGQGPGR